MSYIVKRIRMYSFYCKKCNNKITLDLKMLFDGYVYMLCEKCSSGYEIEIRNNKVVKGI